MKAKSTLFFLILYFITSLFITDAFSQPKVKIELFNPPPGPFSEGNLWKMTLTNLTGSPLQIYLEGNADNLTTNQRIVEATSPTINLPPGRSNYNYRSFESGNVNWMDTTIQNFISRTGTVPAGNYKTCVTAKSADSGNIVGIENCVYPNVIGDPVLQITLITPADRDSINSRNATFTWAGGTLSGGSSYKLKIVQIIGNQSPQVAFESNRAFFEKDGLRISSFQYPLSAPNFLQGKKYAWGVTSGTSNSEIFSFKVKRDQSIIIVPTDTTRIIIDTVRNPVLQDLININLISPSAMDSVQNTRPDFEWSPERIISGLKYNVKVVPINENQSSSDALINNTPLINKSNIFQTSLQYPTDVSSLDTSNNYAWQVSAFDSLSNLRGKSSNGLILSSNKTMSDPCEIEIGQFCWTGNSYLQINSASAFTYTISGGLSGGCISDGRGLGHHNSINVSQLCGNVTVVVRRNGCPDVTRNILIFPNSNFQITNLSNQPLIPVEICYGQEAKLIMPCLGTEFDVKWEYSDDNGSSWTSWGTGSPKNTNTIKPVCTGNYATRLYRGTIFNINNPSLVWPLWCSKVSIKSIKVWCPTVVGTLSATPMTKCLPPGQSFSVTVALSGQIGTITSWTRVPSGGASYGTGSTITDNISIAGNYTYTVTVKNGTCEAKSVSITVKVENPPISTITANKVWICPNEEDVLSLSSIQPPGTIYQWEYQINCTGTWFPAGNMNPTQNTNGMSSSNPYYTGLDAKLCWRIKTPGTPICPDPTYSNVWQYNLIKKPCTPVITSSALKKCKGSSVTLSGNYVPPCTGPIWEYLYQWYLNGLPVGPIIGPNASLPIQLPTTQPGNYYLKVYSKNRCDSSISNNLIIEDCLLNISITGTCCSDGSTPIRLTANATSTCGNAIVSYTWTGGGVSQTGPVLNLNPPPSANTTYTVTVRDAMGCTASASVTITYCP